MSNFSFTKFALTLGLLNLGLLALWITQDPSTKQLELQRPKVKAGPEVVAEESLTAIARHDLSALAGVGKARLEVLSASQAILYYTPDALRYSQRLAYKDPATGTSLLSDELVRSRNELSTSFVTAVKINGIARPATITLADSGMVYVTLPYSRGVLRGQGRNGKVLLQRARPFQDHVKQPPMRPMPTAEQAPEGKCLNCS